MVNTDVQVADASRSARATKTFHSEARINLQQRPPRRPNHQLSILSASQQHQFPSVFTKNVLLIAWLISLILSQNAYILNAYLPIRLEQLHIVTPISHCRRPSRDIDKHVLEIRHTTIDDILARLFLILDLRREASEELQRCLVQLHHRDILAQAHTSSYTSVWLARDDSKVTKKGKEEEEEGTHHIQNPCYTCCTSWRQSRQANALGGTPQHRDRRC